MALSAGDKLGPYEILEPIGKGGMGEVYSAHDTRLKRDVAIKTSATQFSERFEREARVVASLNHPNICHLYDVGPNYLVMELVEGPTLADRIKDGPIPLEESLAIAHQVADALEAAHEKGITHRDLKPGNIKVTPDGSVKVLDFGLAKVSSMSSASGDAAHGAGATPEESPTLSMAATQAGVILGTADYMAPEQAKGKPVDKRADIWAFGVVLYEMVTGKKLFAQEDLTETLASVVRDQADLSAAPRELRRLLKKCLEKDPKRRLRDIGDVWELLGDAPGEAPPAASQTVTPNKLPWGVAAALALGLIATLVLWAPWSTPEPEDRLLARLNVDLGGDVDLGAPVANVTFSRDGTRLAYVATVGSNPPQLYVRRLDQDVATALPGTQGAATPFFSPDGQWIGFGQDGQLKKISVEGGASVSLAEAPAFVGGSWGTDNAIVFSAALTGGLMRVPAAGGTREVLAPLAEGEIAYTQPTVLPGGEAVLFTATRTPGDFDVAVLSLKTGERKTLVPGAAAGRYLPSGHLIYLNGTTLFAVAFDPVRRETRGEAIPILNDVGVNTIGLASLGSSSNGTLVYRSGGAAGISVPPSTVEWLDARGNRTPLIQAPSGYSEIRISPDARRLALSVLDQGAANDHLSVYDIERGGFSPLTFDNLDHAVPIWSPDGRLVVFSTITSLLWARADGAGQPQPLLEGPGLLIPYSFSPDGRVALYQLGNNTDIWTVPVTVEGDRLQAGDPEEFLATQFAEINPMFSPDGRWLAYESNESGRSEVSVRAFPPPAGGEGARFSVSIDGGTQPVWSRNGDELFFRSLDGKIMAARYRVNGENFVADRPRVWAELNGDLAGAQFWDMGPNGQALITVPAKGDSTDLAAPEIQHHVVFLENFFDELKRRVPVEN